MNKSNMQKGLAMAKTLLSLILIVVNMNLWAAVAPLLHLPIKAVCKLNFYYFTKTSDTDINITLVRIGKNVVDIALRSDASYPIKMNPEQDMTLEFDIRGHPETYQLYPCSSSSPTVSAPAVLVRIDS